MTFKNRSLRKFWPFFVFLIILLIGLTASLVLVQKRQVIEKKAVGGPSLTFSKTSLTVYPGQKLTTSIKISTDNQEIRAVDIVLQFPQDKLSLVSIEPTAQNTTSFKTFLPIKSDGSFDMAKVVSEANNTGRIGFGAATFNWQTSSVTTSFKGTLSSLARLTFKAKVPGQAKIVFLHSSGSTIDSNLVNLSAQDILASVNSLTVNIVSPPTATPTPRPTATPTPRPTATPTPRPTATPTPKPAPKPGDITDDSRVNEADYAVLMANFGKTGNWSKGDLTGDGKVNEADYAVLMANFGK